MIISKVRWTDEEFLEAVKNSTSIAEVLKKLNLKPRGSNYGTFNTAASRLSADISHFTGQAHMKGKPNPYFSSIHKKSLTEVLVENSKCVSTNHLKRRLIAEGLLENKCSKCLNTTWLGAPIPIEMDHINGINTDNRIENLRILCPNCHALTSTYRGKNKKTIAKKCATCLNTIAKNRKYCSSCFNSYQYRRIKSIDQTCSSCNKGGTTFDAAKCLVCRGRVNRSTKIIWPSLEELATLLKTTSYLQLGKILGVSDNAIRKHIKNYQNNHFCKDP